MKRAADEIMARMQEQAAVKRRLLELGKICVEPPVEMRPDERAKLEAALAAPKRDR